MSRVSMLDQLLVPGAIRIEFQPMVTVDDDGVALYALESLARGPQGTSMERPNVLFEYARRKGEEARIDRICIAEALAVAATLPGEPHVSINVHGATLSESPDFAVKFLDAAAAYGLDAHRLMFEIVEHRVPWEIDALQTTLLELRAAGVRIALDDLGVGASNYHLFVDCRPDHLKVDRYIVQGCHRDAYRIAVLRSIIELAAACGATPIAEGIEFREDLDVVRELGIRHMQGWMFAPSLAPSDLIASPFLKTQPKESMR